MEIKTQSSVHARFKLMVRSVNDDEITKETGWFNNLVLDSGLARMSVGTWIDRCCVGTGNSTPVVSQTALDGFLSATTTQQSSTSSVQTTTTPYYNSVTITWRFSAGSATGNISEVGLGWSNTTLWNRSLIKDSSGEATTITVLSDEYLDVVSEVRQYPSTSYSGSFDLTDGSGNVISNHTVSGSPYITTPTNSFNKITSYQLVIYSGVKNDSPTVSPTTQVGATQTVTTKYPTTTSVQSVFTVPLTTANGSHQSLLIPATGLFCTAGGFQSSYKFQISPAITKTSSQVMTYTFTIEWGRYTE